MQQTTTSTKVGKDAEESACYFLQQQGLTLVEQNYRCKYGEIDLIMMDNNTIVFIEVRYRKNSLHGSGAETVTYYKQKKLIRTATHYLLARYDSVELPCRIDVVSLSAKPAQAAHWIKNAVEKNY